MSRLIWPPRRLSPEFSAFLNPNLINRGFWPPPPAFSGFPSFLPGYLALSTYLFYPQSMPPFFFLPGLPICYYWQLTPWPRHSTDLYENYIIYLKNFRRKGGRCNQSCAVEFSRNRLIWPPRRLRQ